MRFRFRLLMFSSTAMVTLLSACHSATEPVGTPVAAHVRLSSPGQVVDRGEDLRLTAAVLAADGETVVPNPVIKWTTNNGAIATVTSGGVVHGVGRGLATITATTAGVSGALTVTVTDVAFDVPASLVLSLSSTRLWTGDSLRVTAAVLNKWIEAIPDARIAWSSEAPDLATVSATGVVRGVRNGAARIIATSGTLSSIGIVTVRTPASLRLDGSRTFVPRSAARLSVMGFDAEIKQWSPLSSSWVSSDSGVARVDADGTVTGGVPGTASITATNAYGAVRGDVVTRTLPGRIAYASGSAIRLLTLDGLPARTFTTVNISAARTAALSPDGAFIAFDCSAGICLSPTDRFEIVTVLSSMTGPSWTANGATIAASFGYDGTAIALVGFSPRPPFQMARTLIRATFGAFRPRISPDGSTILHNCQSSSLFLYDDAYRDICSVLSTGGVATLVAPFAANAAWSPDGRKFSYDNGAGACVAVAVDATCTLVFGRSVGDPYEIAWSPDGKFLLVAANLDLWLMEADGSNPVRLADAAAASSPSWALVPATSNGVRR